MSKQLAKPIGSRALPGALDTVEALASTGMRVIPEKPTQDMLAAGCQAGGVPVRTVWNIYQAMLKQAS